MASGLGNLTQALRLEPDPRLLPQTAQPQERRTRSTKQLSLSISSGTYPREHATWNKANPQSNAPAAAFRFSPR
jgi:hypothetical protein